MLIDSHCHLTESKYKKNDITPKDLVSNAVSHDVVSMITVGTSVNDNKDVLNILPVFPNVYAALGIYPHENQEIPIVPLLNTLEDQLSKSNKICAVGECGIDLGVLPEGKGRHIDAQLELFEGQLVIAIKRSLPVVIHSRNGDAYVLEMLKKYSPQGLMGVAHCFVSDWAIAKKFLDLNFYISFSGIVTYPSGSSIHETVAKVPKDKFLVETDSPYLSPQGYRDRINEPMYVKIVAEKVAEIRSESFESVATCSYENTCRLFNIK